MEAKSSHVRWTWAEYARLPESGSTRYEVIDDELVVTPSPTPQHQRIVRRLILALGSFVEDHNLGEIFPAPLDVVLAEGDYFEPDLLFVTKSRSDRYSDRGIEGPPDLVVEILSPSTAARDRGIKLDRYRLFGVPEYWIVDPDERRIEVWDLAGGAQEAAIYGAGDALEWTPPGADRSLEVAVGEIVA
jgi:Uma2 family endonuclease